MVDVFYENSEMPIRYRDMVKVNKGFYEGLTGRVQSMHGAEKGVQVTVKDNNSRQELAFSVPSLDFLARATPEPFDAD